MYILLIILMSIMQISTLSQNINIKKKLHIRNPQILYYILLYTYHKLSTEFYKINKGFPPQIRPSMKSVVHTIV